MKLQIWTRKLHSSQYGSGLPDSVSVINGVTYWIEYKRPGGKLTPQQKSVLSSIKLAGGNSYAIVGTSKRTMDVLDPPDFKVKLKLTKTNGHWDGLHELLGISKPEKVNLEW